MRVGAVAAAGLVLLAAGCAPSSAAPPAGSPAPQPVAMAVPPVPAPPLRPPPGLSQAEVAREVADLRARLAAAVPQHLDRSPAADAAWVAHAQAAIAQSAYRIERPQLIVAVDRNPKVQQMRIILAQPGALPWQVIGGSRVSTGQAGRKTYYITPTGVFLHTADILDYRALGTYNENHIRGLGVKGMRVWDFGWQTARKGWRADGEEGEIRLLIHATDPDHLEQRLGRPASQGCVRVPANMNRFMDMNGILDIDYERSAADDPRVAALLAPGRTPTPLAGRALVVIDSAAAGNAAAGA